MNADSFLTCKDCGKKVDRFDSCTVRESESVYYHWKTVCRDCYNDYNGTDCNHDFKQYQGFRETYRYCTKCDHKVYPKKR